MTMMMMMMMMTMNLIELGVFLHIDEFSAQGA